MNKTDYIKYSNKKIYKESKKMSYWNNYHKITNNQPPAKNIVNFIKKHKELSGNAIDLGCGAGYDTIYLLENNWNVLAIDGTDVESIIRSKLTSEMQNRLIFQVQQFENLSLPKCDLIFSNNSLPFCNKKKFKEMWNEICNSINEGGFFVGNFFGEKDEWNTPYSKRSFFNIDEIKQLFDKFEIIQIDDFEKDEKTPLGKMKHWHIINVVARK